jgi:AraC-like DNA-binding protein
VSDLAFDAGFGGLAHFNRMFRRAYGATPSDVRAFRRN